MRHDLASLAFPALPTLPTLSIAGRAAPRRSLRTRAAHDLEDAGPWDAFAGPVAAFRQLMADADRQAARNGGRVSDDHAERIRSACNALARTLNDRVGDRARLSDEQRRDFEARIRAELMPCIARSALGRRICTKPRGYAGDFLTIAIMYEDEAGGVGHSGEILDRAIRDQPACSAVKNRRGILADEIARSRAESNAPVTRVTSLACGPAAELFDVFVALEDPESLQATCIDIDDQAIDFVANRCDERGLRDRFALHNRNLVHLTAGRQQLDLEPQDLIYSIGLIDYFGDRFVVRLLDYVHGLLAPGGRALFGNFHVDNPSKALMDHVLDWKLVHRTEADMHRLFEASAFGRRCTSIRFEDAGVNMFAECIKTA
ncbi:MAG: class I SAM-dependent methyltransferase [Planctomycetes bacterium]|nr:class I SAM-dependent methyltransferase [Planctomycetota bacterium]